MSNKPIEAFWKWWPAARAKLEAAVNSGAWNKLVSEITAHVHAIDPELHWELLPGVKAKHSMTLSANGNPKLRKKTEAWLKAAPRRTKLWEFYSSRQRRPDTILGYAGKSLQTKDAWVTADFDGERFGVSIFHPAFAKLKKDDRESAAVLLLDGALGEDDVERWLAGISVKTTKPKLAVPLPQLVTEIDRLSAA